MWCQEDGGGEEDGEGKLEGRDRSIGGNNSYGVVVSVGDEEGIILGGQTRTTM